MSRKNLIVIIAAILVVLVVVVGIILNVKDKPETEVKETTAEASVATTIADVTEEETTPEVTEAELTEKTTKEKITQKTPVEKSPYDKILDKYRKAVDDYKKGAVDVSDKNLSANATLFGGNIKYAYVDINGDHVKELVVSSGDMIMNIWKLVDNEMKPLFGEVGFGHRSKVELCRGNVLKIMWYYGKTCETNFYRIESIDYDPVLFNCVVEYGSFIEGGETVYAKFDEQSPSEVSEVPAENIITKAEYEKMLNEYKPVTGINWKKL